MDTKPPSSQVDAATRPTRTAVGTAELEAHPPPGRWARLDEELGCDVLAGPTRTFLVPVQTTSVWYMLGGLLGIAIGIELLTGIVLLIVYRPDAAGAYQSTAWMMANPFWSIVLNIHYFTMYLIFGLVLVHTMRVFLSGAYKAAKRAQWQLGIGLSVLAFAVSATGEALHWDERGMAIPWHIAEFFEAIRLQHVVNYVHRSLVNADYATSKILQLYALHIAVLPVLIIGAMWMHYHVVRKRGISTPFWGRARARMASARDSARGWLLWGGIIFGIVFVISVAVVRTPGPAAQGLPVSPYYSMRNNGDPGGLGTVPTVPISWTHGWNRFVTIAFGWRPDIWGTILATILMIGALVLVPVVDRMRDEPATWRQAFDLRRRGVAFGLIAVFWVVMFIGLITDVLSPIG